VLTGQQYTSPCVNNLANPFVDVSDEVLTALEEERGVVALETTIVVHGLPAPVNIEVAKMCESAVRETGSVPATVGVLNGKVVIGLSGEQVEQLAQPSRNAAKLSARDLGLALGLGRDGATTVAGTIAAASRVGIKVMATGGLGGVHRDAWQSFDESADLTALSRTSMLVVASGVKSILDIGATLERLDTLGVPVVGYRTTQFPGFYRSDSGFTLDWSFNDAREAADVFNAHRAFSRTGLLLANPVAQELQLDASLHERALASALELVRVQGVSGKEVTPVLLAEFARFSGGLSVQVNRELVVANARVAGDVAHAMGR
jgi:pseudouridine-5'-phosphate glycosidase